MDLKQHLAILTLDGELADIGLKGPQSCIIYSKHPITAEVLQIVQMDILECFVNGPPAVLEERKKQPFKALQDVLAQSGYQVLDAGNIAVENGGKRIWVQEPGHEYHSNILNRIVL
ncbi:MAG: hypothetical protein P4L81_05410 [Candidatus Pacebacteria bacterium]|nr:hypothetical protein [Candidatus Paceibacterota bacterium]